VLSNDEPVFKTTLGATKRRCMIKKKITF